ncbi:MAG TPA: class I SAM-dependent methyltransferase [Allosphingosinicella sp.]|jgi:SAM-dependent methyltransferase
MSPSERIVALYEENAAAWDEMRGPEATLERDWIERFAALLRLGGTVLDLGCGSGQPVARDLIRRGFRIVGIDSSQSLIARCRQRFPGQEWVVADMRTLDLGRRFDGAVAWHSSFHLSPDDQRALFPRLAAHLRAGAAMMFTSGDDDGVRIGEWRGEPLYHSSLAPEEYRALLEASGFEVLEHRLRDPECGGATVWIARRTG